MDGLMDGCVAMWMGEWMGGWMDGWVCECVGRVSVDARMDVWIDKITLAVWGRTKQGPEGLEAGNGLGKK